MPYPLKTLCAIIRVSIIGRSTKDLFPDGFLRTWPYNVPAVDMAPGLIVAHD
jgi:hypothetical protein